MLFITPAIYSIGMGKLLLPLSLGSSIPFCHHVGSLVWLNEPLGDPCDGRGVWLEEPIRKPIRSILVSSDRGGDSKQGGSTQPGHDLWPVSGAANPK